MEKIREKKGLIIITVLFAGYLIFNGILLAGHELWRDEANVWLFARDASFIQLLQEIKYQGHPCLWYFIVMPFAKAGLPFKTISVLSFLIMAVAAGIFAYRAPFHPITKLVCLISPMFSYYYSVVARNYCLIALLLILLAYWYPKRNERPIWYGLFLGLLVQADTIALATAGLISCMWLWECICASVRKKEWQPFLQGAKGLWMPLASLVFLVLQFYQISDSPEYQMQVLSFTELLSEIRNFSYHILSRMTGQGEGFGLFLILLFAAAGIAASVKRKNAWPMIVMAGAFLFEVVFSIMIYQLHIWHYIALCFSLIWFLWVGDGVRVLSEGLLILLGITMFLRWNAPEENSSLANAINGLYSDGIYAAEYIKENIETDAVILVSDVAQASTVQAYLNGDYTFYYAGSLMPVTYAKYNEEQTATITYERLLARIKEDFAAQKEIYLLVSQTNCVENISDEIRADWEICYQTKGKSARGEDYILYRIDIR